MARLVLLLLAIGVSTSMAYICSNDQSSPRDEFEEHGCNCGTNTTAHAYDRLYSTYFDAFDQCHEDLDDDTSIECAFIKESALTIKSRLNRTALSRIPVVNNGAQIYNKITCL